MEKSENPNLLVSSSVQIVQNQLGLFRCFIILIEYIFLIAFIPSLILFVFSGVTSVIQTDANAAYLVTIGNMLSRFFGVVAAGYFTFLMIRRYFHASTINLSLSQIGLLPCSNRSALFAVVIGIVLAIVFEYFLPRKYPADPILLEGMSSQFGETAIWLKFFPLLITVAITPIVEEGFFRGFLYTAFSACSGKVPSALIVTTIFVLLHYQVFSYWVALLSLLVGSITLILIREISASLIPSILVHQFYNLGVAVFQ